jgi:hypothetical protein
MKRAVPGRRESPSHGQVFLCLLLVALMLYNPFMGLWGSNDGVCYDRLARNRATVGASELQHFTPVPSDTPQTELDIDVPGTGLMQIVCEELSRTDLQEVIPPQARFFTRYWNKPPPAL